MTVSTMIHRFNVVAQEGAEYTARQLQQTFSKSPKVKSLANFTQTISHTLHFVTDFSPEALELTKKLGIVRKVINPLVLADTIKTWVVKSDRDALIRGGSLRVLNNLFLGGSNVADVLNFTNWLNLTSIGTATVKVVGVPFAISVTSVKNAFVVAGCSLGIVINAQKTVNVFTDLRAQREGVHNRHLAQAMLGVAANIGKVACTLLFGPKLTKGFVALSIGTGVAVIAKLIVDNHVAIKDEDQIKKLQGELHQANQAIRNAENDNQETKEELIRQRDNVMMRLQKMRQISSWQPTPLPV